MGLKYIVENFQTEAWDFLYQHNIHQVSKRFEGSLHETLCKKSNPLLEIFSGMDQQMCECTKYKAILLVVASYFLFADIYIAFYMFILSVQFKKCEIDDENSYKGCIIRNNWCHEGKFTSITSCWIFWALQRTQMLPQNLFIFPAEGAAL